MSLNRHQATARLQLSRFILTGLAATATHYLVLRLGVDVLLLDPVVATFPAFGIAFLLGYNLNRRWTFKATTAHRRALPAYLVVALLGLGNNALLMFIAVHVLRQSDTAGFLASVFSTPILTYLGNRYYVFR